MMYKDVLSSLTTILQNGEYYTHHVVLFALIVVFLFTFLSLYYGNFVFGKRSPKRVILGDRPVHDIHGERHLLREIHYAVSRCGENPALIKRCMKLLSKFPAAVNLPLHEDRFTPFLRACYIGCPELVTYMLQMGADVKTKSAMGDNALYLAIDSIVSGRCNTFDMAEQLISAGVDVNGCRVGSYTALHLAAARGHGAAVRWLLSRGADPAPPTPAPSPRRLAQRYGHLATAALLQVTADTADEAEHSRD